MNVTNEFYNKSERFSTLKQESPKGDFHWATKFPGGEGGCTHSGHQACRWPLRNTASHLNIVPLWETFVTKKMSTIFKSGLYSTFSNSSIMNTNEQVSHCKQETRSVIFTHPSPNPSAPPPPKYTDQFDPTGNSKNYCSTGHKTLFNNTKQYISQFWFLKLTKQIKFKFCFCLILRHKAFLTVLLNICIYICIFFWRGDLQQSTFPRTFLSCTEWVSHAKRESQ